MIRGLSRPAAPSEGRPTSRATRVRDTTPAPRNATQTATSVTESVGRVAKRYADSTFVAANDSAIPTTRPRPTRRRPWPITCQRIRGRLAPSAIRTPNSSSRWVTEIAMTPLMPAMVTTSASAANTVSKSAVSFGVARDWRRSSPSVATFLIGMSGSTAWMCIRSACAGSVRNRNAGARARAPWACGEKPYRCLTKANQSRWKTLPG